MDANVFHVVRIGVDGSYWAVRRDGTPGNPTKHASRDDAVATARAIAA